MNTIYHYVGLFFFWALVLAGALVLGYWVWDSDWFATIRRRGGNLRLIFHTAFAGKRLPITRNNLQLAISFGGRRGVWRADWWERDVIAYHIKYARKLGYPEPDND